MKEYDIRPSTPIAKGTTMGNWVTLNGHDRKTPLSAYFTNRSGNRAMRGPIPNEPIYAFHPLEMCYLCTWITKGYMRWEIKFINRRCPVHETKVAQPVFY